ncbi:MAG TPA: hypothetical protein VMA95_03240 [Streptosporangiaceae bacterium]|nr:hypothetical protein [Streptosporangiaceae bacterium]
MAKIMKGRVVRQAGGIDCRAPNLPVVVIAAHQVATRGAAQDLVGRQLKLFNMVSNGVLNKPGERHFPN